jgi:DNA segregation ATPase FtsK/SpoIIIE, S-DNA-T family
MKFKKIKNYILSLILFFIAMFLLFSQLTFSPNDNSWFYYNSINTDVRNFFGYSGAVVSSLFFYLFGYATYVFIIFLFYYSYFIYGRLTLKNKIEELLSFFSLLLSLSVFFQSQSNKMGGLLGIYLNKFLLKFFDLFLIKFISVSILIISILLITRCSFVTIVSLVTKSLNGLKFLLKKIRPIIKFTVSVFTYITIFFKQIFKWTLSLFNQKLFESGDPEYLYEEKDFWQKYVFEDNSVGNNSVDSVKIIESKISNVVMQKDLKNNCISYQLPNLEIFTAVEQASENKKIYEDLEKRARVLEDKLEKFGVFGKVKTIEYGPVVTLFEYSPNVDIKISKIMALEDDLALALEAMSIRIIAPIPGKPFVGFEVANKTPRTVYFSNIIHSKEFKAFKGELPLILGKDSIGRNVVVDLFKMPHLLVAGSTGAGKSVALNSMLASLLCKHSPDQLKLILIDPKRLEFSSYQDIAHLLFPIVTQPKRSVEVLKWLVNTMEQRYEIMSKKGVKNINDYHLMFDQQKTEMPFIVLIIDELADLMMTTGKEIEVLIARIAQMARAAGIHMIIATQRPSVDVITGLIKVNFPSRISFRVVSKIDSRTILDASGAEKLLGRGDMLFLNSNSSSLERIHGAYVTTNEINDLVDHIKSERDPNYIELNLTGGGLKSLEDVDDEMFVEVIDFLQEVDEISISFLQRKFRIGYNRSARIMEQLEELGYILPADGCKMRKVVKDSEMK